MLEAFTNTKIAPTSFFGSSPLGDEIKHSNPKQPEQEMGTLPQLQDSNKLGIVHTDHSRGEPRELYYDVVQPAGNAKIKVLSWVESPTANIDLHHSSKNIIEEVLKHGLLKRLHAITQQESNEVSPPFSLTIAPLAANVDQGYADKSLILSEISKRLDDIAQREYDWDEFESKKPLEVSLDRARCLMEKLLNTAISKGYSWRKPHPYICSDEDGYITVEWQGEGRRLRLRIEEDEVEYIKLWRINTKRKVRAYRMRSDDCFEIWEWLING